MLTNQLKSIHDLHMFREQNAAAIKKESNMLKK